MFARFGAGGDSGESLNGALDEEVLRRSESEVGDFARSFEGASRCGALRRQKSDAHRACAFGDGISVEFFFEAVVGKRQRVASNDAEFVGLRNFIDQIVVKLSDGLQLPPEEVGSESEPTPPQVFVDHLCRFKKCA